LGILKRHYLRGIRVIRKDRIPLKTEFVTCSAERMPVRLRWMRDVPYDIREQATNELSLAYKSAFAFLETNPGTPFPDIKFRSKKYGEPAITIPTKAFSKQSGRRWEFYVSKFPGKLKFRQRDVRRVLDRNADGPVGDTKLRVTRTGKYYLHVPIYVKKTTVSPENMGHFASYDPGASPFITYYSPTRFVAGSFGLGIDVQQRINVLQSKYNRFSSRLTAENASYLRHGKRRKLLRRRLLLQEKVRNLTRECIHKIILYLTSNYHFIHGSTFGVANMVERRPGSRIGRTTRRTLLTWHHGPLKTLLLEKAEQIEGLRVGLHDEAYTTKTCGSCGHRHNIGGSKLFHCPSCGYTVHRDVNGARNQALKNCVGNYEWVARVVRVGRLTLFI